MKQNMFTPILKCLRRKANRKKIIYSELVHLKHKPTYLQRNSKQYYLITQKTSKRDDDYVMVQLKTFECSA
jgi:hypothetical protein